MTPWAQAIFNELSRNFSKGNPSSSCLPHGVPEAMMIDSFKIVQHSGVTLVLYEEFARFRQIFTDGRTHPAEMNPAWLGYSIGKWDSDVFVVDTRGFNDRSWLDFAGHPHSEQLRVIERFRRTDFGHMQLELTFEDSVAYSAPWSASLNFELMPDTDLIENICENEKDGPHIVGRVPSDDRPAVTLSIEQLREYEGVYGERRGMSVALIDGRLVFNGAQLIPVSATDFSSTVGNVEFFRDSSGQIDRLLWTVLGEGELDLKRRR
jgi:hypothetical protein